MKVLICGEAPRRRSPWTRAVSKAYMDAVQMFIEELSPGDVVINGGGARGVDSLAAAMADGYGHKVITVVVEWDRYGRAAGPKRNRKMLEMGPDLVVAFHRDLSRSKGTANMLEQARKVGIRTRLYVPEV